MEFIDHRPYRAGDDTRHLDPQLFARTGEYMMREYSLNQQLPVTIVLDLSPSMAAGNGEKTDRAKLLAQLLGFSALAGGDRIEVAVPNTSGTKISPRWHGTARADYMFDWIDKELATQAVDFAQALRDLREQISPRSLVIAISDWWDEATKPSIDILASTGHEVLAVQVLLPGEKDPAGLENGVVIMEDAENGEEIEMVIDAGLLGRYRKLFDARQAEMRSIFNAKHWHFVTVFTNDDIYELFTRTLRTQGVLS